MRRSNVHVRPSNECVQASGDPRGSSEITVSWFTQTRIATVDGPARSLSWRDDQLVDWVRGGDYWTAEGRFQSARRSWGYDRFDGVVADSTGRWPVVHERTGTAGILLRDGKIVREIHRSPYHADAFLYPICLFRLNDRVVLAHCPESCARIEIEDADTGERLTRSTARKETDFFHSRLAASPGGKRLMSAGWVWHPWDAVVWFDVAAALAEPTSLDALDGSPLSRNVSIAEESSAAWLDDDRILIGGSSEAEDPEEAAETDREHPGPRLRPNGLSVYDIPSRAHVQSVDLGYPPGSMMAAGSDHVVTFFRQPRLISLMTGKIAHEWSDIDSGEAVSSIVRDLPCPPLALDPTRARFAVAGKQGIDVITIDAAALARV
jgi:hypothetical protein